MKIDSHVHITPPDIIADWEKYAKKEPYFAMLSNSKHNKFASAQDVIAMLEKNNFDMAVVFGFAFRDLGLCRYVNDYVIESIKKFPEKLVGFAVVPNDKGAANEIERCYNAGLKGVGELFLEGQGIIPEDKKETAALAGACLELDIPLLLHANEQVGRYYAGKSGVSLKQIETFAANNPDLKIILAHFGGGLLFYEAMGEIKEKFCNVYYDTAAAPFLYDSRVYRVVKALGLCEKIIFGSDFPLLSPSRYFADIEACDLSDNEKQLLLGGNIKRILGERRELPNCTHNSV